MNKALIFFATLTLVFSSCATHKGAQRSSGSRMSKIKNRVVAQYGDPHSAVSRIPKAKEFKIDEQDKLLFELNGEKVETLSEFDLYQKCIEKYRADDMRSMHAYVNVLVGKYPQSVFADNALYMEGMLAISQKNYGQSLLNFNKVLSLYPLGNKAVSALFAKGILLKRMNLKSQAKAILEEVKQRYPGSPESARADIELLILKQ